jgi:hypothetical protein
MDALRERVVFHYGQRIDLAPVVAETLDRLARTVIAAAGQLWGNGARLRAILVSGGGAHLVYRLLLERKAASSQGERGIVLVIDELMDQAIVGDRDSRTVS